MRRVYLLCVAIFSLIGSVCSWATPPTNLKLGYDGTKIHIDADHPSDRLDRHFIHTVIVTNNDGKQKYFYFPRQTTANKFIVDIKYPAVEGDRLTVELRCSEGGNVKGTIIVHLVEQRKETNDQKTVSS